MADEPTPVAANFGPAAEPDSNCPIFHLAVPDARSIPVLIAAPHGGRDYPQSLLARMRKPGLATLRLEDRHVDSLACRIAEATGAALLVAHAPRAMIDLNRAEDDLDWEMVSGGRPAGVRHSLANRRARSGLGLIPRRLPGIGELWRERIDRDELDTRITRIHRPYHAALAQALDRLRDRWGAALLIDLHSMPPLKRRHPDDVPAEFVIGDRFGAACDPLLVAEAFRYFASERRLAVHNRPYAGGYVLDRHAAPARGIHAVQLEICRSLYLDREQAELTPCMVSVVRVLAGLVRHLAVETASLGSRGMTLAAE